MLLGVGIYKGEDGKPYVLDSVRKAEQIMLDKKQDKEYAFPDGYPTFRKVAIELSWGADHPCVKEGRVASMQTVSGTGGLKMGFMLMRKFFPKAKAYVPNPTWSLHHNIIKSTGFDLTYFRYYNPKTKSVDVEGMLEDLSTIEDEQILLLQASCHNPSGCDLTKDDWKRVLEVCKTKKHFCFFDSAYQGFANDDYNEDNWSLRYFAANYNRVMLTQSFSKNFGLYGERTGCLSMVCADHDEQLKVQTLLKDTCLPEYSNPPIHGARIVETIMGDPTLKELWHSEVKAMGGRLRNNRKEMVEKLKNLGSTHDWSHIQNQIGMFAYTGLTEQMVEVLKTQYAIYLPYDGRVCVASITQNNIDYVCECFHKVSDGKEL